MNSIVNPIVQKKPIVAFVIQFLAAYVAVVDGLYALAVLAQFRTLAPITIIGTFLLSVLVAAMSARVFLGLSSKPFKKRSTVSLYLWAMLFLYPITNILRSFDAYTAAPHLENNQLFGAYIAELGRYVFYIILIVWVGFSKALVNFLSRSPPLTTQSRGPP